MCDNEAIRPVSGPSNPSALLRRENCAREPPFGTNEASDAACKHCRSYLLGYAGNIRRISQASVNLLLGYEVPKPRMVPRQISYGRLDEISKREACRFCEFLLRLIKAELDLPHPKASQGAGSEDLCSIVPDKESVSQLLVTYQHVAVTLTLGRIRLPAPEPPSLQYHTSSGPDPQGYESVSVGMIKSWVDDCQKPQAPAPSTGTFFHSVCHKLPQRYGAGPWELTFIDVVDRCLVLGNTTHKYFALSYVWGRDPFLQTTTVNLARHQKKQSLTREGGVPDIIYDAMELTELLGVRYIWVDALCLVQDDRASKYEGIRIMHIVYAHAHLTIVAASAKTAFSPLPGLRKGTRCPLASRDVKGKQLQRASGVTVKELTYSTYQTRGWTMQEFLMSRRCLVFAYDQVYFRCSSAVVSELDSNPRNLTHSPARMLRQAQLEDLSLFSDFDSGTGSNAKPVSDGRGRPASSFDYERDFPHFVTYMNLVQKYTCRKLTDPSDILNAFSALQAALSLQMNCGFEFGLPLGWFGMALLWRPFGTCRARRRIVSDQRSPAAFPTWSWAGWLEEVRWVDPVAPDKHPDLRRTFKELVPFAVLRIDSGSPEPASGPSMTHTGDTFPAPTLHKLTGSLTFEAEVVGSRNFGYREVSQDTIHRGSLEILPKSKAERKAPESSSGSPEPAGETWKDTYRVLWRGPDDGLGRGIVFSMEAGRITQGNNVDLVALSTFCPRKIWRGYPGSYYQFDEGTGGNQNDLPFLNCLVVEWCGDYAERIGVAQIGSLAWRDAGPTRRCITIR